MGDEPLDLGLVAQHVQRMDGQGRAMLELTRELAARGHRITLYCQGRAAELEGMVVDRSVPHVGGLGPVTAASFFVAASRAVRRGRHDAACVLGPCALPPAPFAYYAQFSHAGWQATWTEGGMPRPKHRVLSHVGRSFERIVAPRADVVLTCHRHVGRELGVSDARVVAVPNGVDAHEFAPREAAERRGIRRGWGVPADAWVVAFIGEFNTTRKGLDSLVEAVAAGPPDEHLVVAGSGDRQRLRRDAERLGAGGRIHAVGFADAAEVLAGADAAAVPSRYEPFSIVAVEAAAARVPLVLSGRAGAAEHLRGAARIVADPEDRGALRQALDGVRGNPEETAELVERAARTADELRWTEVAARAADAVEAVARR